MTWADIVKAAPVCIGLIFILEATKAALGFWPAFGIAVVVLVVVAALEGGDT